MMTPSKDRKACYHYFSVNLLFYLFAGYCTYIIIYMYMVRPPPTTMKTLRN